MAYINISRKKTQFILFLFDLLAFLVAIWGSLVLRHFNLPDFTAWLRHIKLFFPILFYAICAMYLLGLYVINRPIGNRTILTKLSMIGIFGWCIGFVFFYFQHDKLNFPKTILLYFWICFCFITFINRFILFQFLKRRHIPVVFLGNSK